MPEKGLTLKEAAARLHVSVNTLRYWCAQKRIPAVKVGRVWLMTEGTIDAILRGEVEVLPPETPPPPKRKSKKRIAIEADLIGGKLTQHEIAKKHDIKQPRVSFIKRQLVAQGYFKKDAT